ncbi:HNH endonuclease signature motif containing protein [Brevibacterium sp. UCMA 11754]|uniref:HNH endonuclease signature motif containing protein n=1 Tax=Brevibacterium sp. UCMA 11754 TaxID=2749198 RepID=UPI001F2B4A9D|nr:HNH endonuclease signature motif containing protein [Brevibacterium sp. UCMA 11754]MCF2572572.1 HNH endonuclease [Brevibacterium sp. UCMA 11754]
MKFPSESDSTGSEPARDSDGTSHSTEKPQPNATSNSNGPASGDATGPASPADAGAGAGAGADTGADARGAARGPTHFSRRLRIDADSPFADAAKVFAASDQAQLSALDVSAELFFNETVENLRLYNPHPGQPYAHATIAETVRRFQRDRRSSGAAKSKTPKRGKDPDRGKKELPSFPRFRLDQTFYGWVHELSQAEDIAEFTTVLGTTTARAYSQITSAMILLHGLPKFFARCLAGEFTIEHVHATAHACRDIKFENLPLIDDYLADRRADITLETFKKSLGMKIAVVEPLEERVEEASKRRRVDITTTADGTAFLTLAGPAPELQACYLRIGAFARAIRSGSIAAFSDQLAPGTEIDDDRGIDALMFDILTRTIPQLSIQVTATDTTTGETSTHDIPLDVPAEQPLTPASVINNVNERIAEAGAASATASAATVSGSSSEANEEANRVEVVLTMPTHEQWLGSQAKMITTVPFLTLAGSSELPGTFSDGSPIPADTARRVARHAKSWTRILTDPASGTPVDAKATTYQIPENVRQTLIAKWQACTIPGCTRRAETTEIDHIVPFDHAHPAEGGHTRFGNLHPLCKLHHQAKTDRKYSVRMNRTGFLQYVFRHGMRTEVAAGDHPINAAHAKMFFEMQQQAARTSDPPKTKTRAADEPWHGDKRISQECPGPPAADGQAGWVKNNSMLNDRAKEDEWIWDAGGPPPF